MRVSTPFASFSVHIHDRSVVNYSRITHMLIYTIFFSIRYVEVGRVISVVCYAAIDAHAVVDTPSGTHLYK